MFTMLRKLMDEEKVFTQRGLNRKTLSVMLDTNEKYLHELIKEVTGMSCSEYINSLRLDYARIMLEDANNNKPSRPSPTSRVFCRGIHSTEISTNATVRPLCNTETMQQ